MRALVAFIVVIALAVTVGSAAPSQRGSSGAAADRPPVSQAEYLRWQTDLSNWGRWGTDDEMGTLNLITPAKRKAAAALVKEGTSISLAFDARTEKTVETPCPIEWSMLTASEDGATDRVGFPCIHGAGSTHLDSLAHVFFSGRMWNGYRVSGLVTRETGAARNSVLTMKNGIVTRGVLYDMPRLKGVAYLEPGTRIFAEDLEAWERKSGARVGPGDALLLRTGLWARRAAAGPATGEEGTAGLDPSVIPWLKKRDIALLGWEIPWYLPQPPGDLSRTAVHNFVQTILGIHVLDRGSFETLSEAAARGNRWEFLFVVTPLAIPRATGSPVNPIAVF